MSKVKTQTEAPARESSPSPVADLETAAPQKTGSSQHATPRQLPSQGVANRARMISSMQQTVGNARLSRVLSAPGRENATQGAIQKKSLEVSNPTDTDEKEADEVARKVVDGQSAEIHGTGGTVNRSAEGAAKTTPAFQSKLEGSRGGGQSLDDSVKSDMESKTGADFSDIKVHTGSDAHNMSESINAKAFTQGRDIYFKQGEYNPDSKQGKELLAHELVHTAQQSNGVGRSIQRQKDKKKSSAAKREIIKIVVHENVHSYKVIDLDQKTAASGNFDKSQMEQEINVSEKVGKDKQGKFFFGLYTESHELIEESFRHITLIGETEVIVKTITELTSKRETYKNYDQLKARMDELEIAEPQLKGKMYLKVIYPGDTIENFAKSTVSENETNYGNLSKKLQQLNQKIATGVVGNGVILLKGWKDPRIGTMPAPPVADSLTEDQKQLIATLYGEIHGAKYSGTPEQIKYIFYSMVLRVKSPAYAADLYEVLRSGAYQAHGANQYKIAKKQLDENKLDADLSQVKDLVISAWSNTPPADAGVQYSHFSAKSSDAVKISDYYQGSKTKIDEVAENEAVYKFLVKKGWDTGGLSKTKAWKKRIRLNEGALEGTMYIFN